MYYTRNPLIWHRCNWTGAGLLLYFTYTDQICYRKFSVTAQPYIRACAPVSYFHFVIKRLCFSNFLRPSHGFSLEHISVNRFYNTFSTCQCIRISSVSASRL